jgi:arylsulfatase A-like enzyme
LAHAACAAPPRPGILLVVADTARADRFSSNGYGRPTTPATEALGHDGAVYLRAYTPAPWTLPAHASLFTGLYPSAHGADSGRLHLDPALPVLARRLRDAGYRTQAYVANPWVGKDYGFQEGFDTFEEVWRGVHGTEGDMGAAALNDRVARWLDWRADNTDARARPFFIFVNYFEPHLPYNPPEPERGRFLRPGADPGSIERLRRLKHPEDVRQILAAAGGGPAGGALTAGDFAILSDLYDGEIAYVDRRAGELVALLKARGLLDQTVVVLTSDHGEMIGEHGLMDHKLDVREPVLRIPLVLRYPPAVAAGQRIDAPVMLQDVYPTLLALAGVATDAVGANGSGNGAPAGKESGPGRHLEARPLPGVAGLRSGSPRGRSQDDPLIAEHARPVEFLPVLRMVAPEVDIRRWERTLVAWQAGGRKLIWASDGRHRLYDLSSDPGEDSDLAAAAGAGPADGTGGVEAWLARPAARPPLAAPPGRP